MFLNLKEVGLANMNPLFILPLLAISASALCISSMDCITCVNRGCNLYTFVNQSTLCSGEILKMGTYLSKLRRSKSCTTAVIKLPVPSNPKMIIEPAVKTTHMPPNKASVITTQMPSTIASVRTTQIPIPPLTSAFIITTRIPTSTRMPVLTTSRSIKPIIMTSATTSRSVVPLTTTSITTVIPITSIITTELPDIRSNIVPTIAYLPEKPTSVIQTEPTTTIELPSAKTTEAELPDASSMEHVTSFKPVEFSTQASTTIDSPVKTSVIPTIIKEFDAPGVQTSPQPVIAAHIIIDMNTDELPQTTSEAVTDNHTMNKDEEEDVLSTIDEKSSIIPLFQSDHGSEKRGLLFTLRKLRCEEEYVIILIRRVRRRLASYFNMERFMLRCMNDLID